MLWLHRRQWIQLSRSHRILKKVDLILFTRYPRLGICKTRLAKEIGFPKATEIQRRLIERALKACKTFCKTYSGAQFSIYYCDATQEEMESLYPGVVCREQSRGDIGQRMDVAFQEGFERGAEIVILLGSDIPDIVSAHFDEVLSEMERFDIAMIPSTDGGYLLLALKEAAPYLFPTEMEWSTKSVAEKTAEFAIRAGKKISLLSPMNDIDTLDDLLKYQNTPLMEQL